MPETTPIESYFDSKSCRCRVYLREREATGSEAVGNVLLLHGLGDHSERHDKVALLLSAAGFRVTAMDWPGNGRSGRKKGDMPLLPEARDLLSEVVAKMPSPPVGVFAHSTGGFIFLHTLLQEMEEFANLKWLWLSSPLLAPAHGQAPWKIDLASRLVDWIPGLTLSTGVKVTDCFSVTPQPDQIAKVFDVRSHNLISLRFANELMNEEEHLREQLGKLDPNISLLLTEGTEDTVCPFRFARDLFKRISFRKKTFFVIHSAYHEPLRQPDPERIYNAIRNWLNLQIAEQGH